MCNIKSVQKFLAFECMLSNFNAKSTHFLMLIHFLLLAAFNKAKSTFGKVDVLINNAGILNENQWKKMIEVNFVSMKCYFLIIFLIDKLCY